MPEKKLYDLTVDPEFRDLIPPLNEEELKLLEEILGRYQRAEPEELSEGQRKQVEELVVTGRHDPCIVHRAVPVIEAAAALAACQVMGM